MVLRRLSVKQVTLWCWFESNLTHAAMESMLANGGLQPGRPC